MIPASKVMRLLVRSDSKFGIGGVGVGMFVPPMDKVARFVCPWRNHSEVTIGCGCGLYAVRDEGLYDERGFYNVAVPARGDRAQLYRGHVLLSGTVDEYRLGYIAERQQLTYLDVANECVVCGGEAVALMEAGEVKWYRNEKWRAVVPVCEEELGRRRAWSLKEASERLGVPVEFENMHQGFDEAEIAISKVKEGWLGTYKEHAIEE